MTPKRPDNLCASAGAILLVLLTCWAGCSYAPSSRAGSGETDSPTSDNGGDDPSSAGKVPAAGAKTEKAQSPEPVSPPEEPAPANVSRRARNISFDTIKFEMEKRDRFAKAMLTPTINALDRKRVKIRGFMFPTSVRAGINSFILVRDNQECCFGPGAALFDAIAVQMRVGETTEYAFFPITVEGVFHIDPIENPLYGEGPLENSHLYIFRLDDALVTKR